MTTQNQVRFVLGLLLLSAAPATAQTGRVGIGVNGGSLGIGGEVSVRLTDRLVARTGYTTWTIDRQRYLEGIRYKIQGKLQAIPVLLDFHPSRGTLRFTAGVLLQPPQVELLAGNPGSLTIGGNSYNSTQVSAVHGQIKAASVAPLVGFGFDRTLFTRSRVTAGFDFGIAYLGEPKPTFTATTTLTGPALTQLEENLTLEEEQLQDGINDIPTGFRIYPMIAFSLKLRI